jgi:hypothetical protein
MSPTGRTSATSMIKASGRQLLGGSRLSAVVHILFERKSSKPPYHLTPTLNPNEVDDYMHFILVCTYTFKRMLSSNAIVAAAVEKRCQVVVDGSHMQS